MKLNSAQVERTLTQFEAQVPRGPSVGSGIEWVLRRPHVLPRPQWVECCRAEGEYRTGRPSGGQW